MIKLMDIQVSTTPTTYDNRFLGKMRPDPGYSLGGYW